MYPLPIWLVFNRSHKVFNRFRRFSIWSILFWTLQCFAEQILHGLPTIHFLFWLLTSKSMGVFLQLNGKIDCSKIHKHCWFGGYFRELFGKHSKFLEGTSLENVERLQLYVGVPI